MRTSVSLKPFVWLSGRQQPSSYLWPNMKLQGGGASQPTIPRLQLEQYMPSPASSNFRIMREQRTLALARALQTYSEESSCPTGVLGEAVRELKQYMTPLLALNGNEIGEASFLQSMEEECRTSPMPEEKATLLGNIKPSISNLMSNLTLKHPKFPSCCRSVSRHSLQRELLFQPPLPSPPSPPSPLSFPRDKENPRAEQPEWMP